MAEIVLTQKTLHREGRIEGIGLHTGVWAQVFFKPAAAGTGIRFCRDGKPFLKLIPQQRPRCSSVSDGTLEILTVEHLLAALRGLGITNLVVDVHGPEIPGLDGSAKPFVDLFRKLGIAEQNERCDVYRIREPIFCHEKNAAIAILPSEEFSIGYLLDYDFPHLKDQKVQFTIHPDNFETQIAPARTFCTAPEARALKAQGFGLGATPENTLVVSEDGAHLSQLRFSDECARHKVLDILGDLSLLGFPVLGQVIGLRSGHALNRRLADAILKQREAMETRKEKTGQENVVMTIEGIKKVLPHRYPFLLVDRILEMTDTRVVGIRNVTANEPFFQGHFPEKAVMPGVLMVEAIAQVGGVLMLSKGQNKGKLAYLVSISNARFRRMVIPGDQLRIEVELLRLKSKIGIIKGCAYVGTEEACDAEIMFSLADE